MSFHFEFNIGFYNAWLLIIPAWLFDYILGYIKKEGFKRASDISWYTSREKFIAFSSMVLMVLFVICSIFVSLKIGTAWFYIGICITIAGIVGKTTGQINFYGTPPGEPITTGVYKVSRNPMYFFGSLVMGGAAIASQSGILLIIFLLAVIATHFVILGEERHLSEEYKESYRKYKDSTPRYFLFFK